MITQKELARILGVSQVTVSAILRNGALAEHYRPELRRKVLETAAKLGYCRNEIACAVRNRKSNVIGFMTQEFSNGYAGLILEGIMDAASKHSYLVKTFSVFREEEPSQDTFEREAEYIASHCIGQRLAGLISFDVIFPEILNKLSAQLKQAEIPLVLAGTRPKCEPDCIELYSDMEQAGKLIFNYLYGLGHRKIALTGPYDWAPNNRCLIESINKAAAEYVDPKKNIIDLTDLTPDSFCFETVRKKLQRFAPTAIFCLTDFNALEMITSLGRLGIKVPEDISVLGYGNLRFSRNCQPQITSVDNNLYNIGYRAAEILLETITHPGTPIKTEYCAHTLVKRSSCSKI